MALLVETYEEVETVGPECEVETDAEALELIEQLGLDGQRELSSRKDDGTTVRSPYRKATKEESFVCRMICPEATLLTKYNAGPIPLRVMQVAAHATDMFDFLFVLHPKQVVKDPFLVGCKGKYDWSPWSNEVFMLARWGAELAPWPELKAKAASMFREGYKAALEKIRAEIVGIDIDAVPDGVLCSASSIDMPRVFDLRNW